MNMEHWWIGSDRGNEELIGDNPDLGPLVLIWDQTRACAMGGRRLTN